MAYAPLDATGYLASFAPGLNQARRAQAELAADIWVDTEFRAWERATWSGDGLPPDVKRAAELFGAAEYIQLDYVASNPGVEEIQSVAQMRQQARQIAQDARQRGWILGPDREPQAAQKAGPSRMFQIFR